MTHVYLHSVKTCSHRTLLSCWNDTPYLYTVHMFCCI